MIRSKKKTKKGDKQKAIKCKDYSQGDYILGKEINPTQENLSRKSIVRIKFICKDKLLSIYWGLRKWASHSETGAHLFPGQNNKTDVSLWGKVYAVYLTAPDTETIIARTIPDLVDLEALTCFLLRLELAS